MQATGPVPRYNVQDGGLDDDVGWWRWRWFRVRDGYRRLRGGRGQVRVRGVRGWPLAAGRVQRPQRVVQWRALEQQSGDGGHGSVAAAAAAASAVVGHVHAVADGRAEAPGQLRGPVRGHGGHTAQRWPRGQGPDAAGSVHPAHERVAELVHGTAGRPEPARLGARLEDDAAQRAPAAATAAPSSPAAAAAAASRQ